SATLALLDRGADPALADENGLTSLHYAAQAGASETIRALLAAGAVQTQRNSAGATALDVAARWGHVEAVRVLAENVEALRASRRALIWATNHANEDVVVALLAAGADPDAAPENL